MHCTALKSEALIECLNILKQAVQFFTLLWTNILRLSQLKHTNNSYIITALGVNTPIHSVFLFCQKHVKQKSCDACPCI